MEKLTLSIVLFSVLVGCAGAEPHPAEQAAEPQQAATTTNPTDPAQPSTPDQASAPSAPAAGSPACPDVKGAWGGPVDGVAQVVSSSMDEKVEGTSTLELVATDGDDNELTFDGSSIFDVVIKSGLGDIPLKQSVSGKVSCGAFAAHLSTKAGGSSLAGDATCELTADGCTGTWTVNENDKLVAKGTFTLSR